MPKLNTIFFWIAMANVVAISFLLGTIYPIQLEILPIDSMIFIGCLILYLVCSVIMSYYWIRDPENIYK